MKLEKQHNRQILVCDILAALKAHNPHEVADFCDDVIIYAENRTRFSLYENAKDHAESRIKKLAPRAERGVIGGSGDNR